MIKCSYHREARSLGRSSEPEFLNPALREHWILAYSRTGSGLSADRLRKDCASIPQLNIEEVSPACKVASALDESQSCGWVEIEQIRMTTESIGRSTLGGDERGALKAATNRIKLRDRIHFR
jgi:hypothetical protein